MLKKEIKDEIALLKDEIKEKEEKIKRLKKDLKNINEYETFLVLKPNIKASGLNKIKKELSVMIDYIEDFKKVGKNKLACNVKGYDEGYFVLIKWEGNEETKNKIEKYIRANIYHVDEKDTDKIKNILKFITIEDDRSKKSTMNGRKI